LADGNLGLKAGHQAKIGYLVDAEKGLTPLISLCGFRDRFWSPSKGLHTLGFTGEPATRDSRDGDRSGHRWFCLCPTDLMPPRLPGSENVSIT
jgi:hypothetical protein